MQYRVTQPTRVRAVPLYNIRCTSGRCDRIRTCFSSRSECGKPLRQGFSVHVWDFTIVVLVRAESRSCIDNVCKNKELKLWRFTRFHGLAGFALVTVFIFQKPRFFFFFARVKIKISSVWFPEITHLPTRNPPITPQSLSNFVQGMLTHGGWRERVAKKNPTKWIIHDVIMSLIGSVTVR